MKVSAISASSYIVMDQDSGRILESHNSDSRRLIASITKIMTAVVAIEYGNIEDDVEIGNEIITSYGSGVYISIGEELTLDDLLYGLMLRSGNDAALAIAHHVGGSIENFVFLMNEMADKIGMVNTSFVNPSGLEERDGSGNYSTVLDMAKLTQYAMNNEHYRRIVSTDEIVVKSSLKTYKWVNKNKLLHSYEYCNGGKTGFTKKARRTLVTTASKDGMNLIVVTFNDGDDFKDHKNLYEKYFNNFKVVKILNKGDKYGFDSYIGKDFKLIVNDSDNYSTNVVVDNKEGKRNGEIVGKVEVLVNNRVVGYRYLYLRKVSVQDNKSVFSRLYELIRSWKHD
jgi:D-alanyl-D-alanine carboxypeptidase